MDIEREARRLRGLVYSEMNYLCNDFDKKLNRLEEQFKSALARVRDEALEEAEKKLGFSHKIFTPETPAFQMGSYNEGINGAIKVVRTLRSKGRKDSK